MQLESSLQQRIEQIIGSQRVVLFMKGTPQLPQCGFSAQTAGALESLIGNDYASFNVLEDPDIREGIKQYGNWPTIPQLYVDGELVGGCDIVLEMLNAGELHDLFGLEAPDRSPPDIEITPAAADKIRGFLDDYPDQFLHFNIGADWDAQFNVGPKSGTEIEAQVGALTVLMDLNSAQRARGARIDWVSTMQGEGLKLDLPGAPPPVQDMSAATLTERLEQDDELILIDTRSEADRMQRPLAQARILDADLMAELGQSDRATPLVFACNIGQSSRAVAEHYRKEGFTEVYNLTGGVSALFG
ncbi:MAG: Grx4 family monothiol glutaredoxin [Pseudomonadota bacterium]